jgi:hypothetical protein
MAWEIRKMQALPQIAICWTKIRFVQTNSCLNFELEKMRKAGNQDPPSSDYGAACWQRHLPWSRLCRVGIPFLGPLQRFNASTRLSGMAEQVREPFRQLVIRQHSATDGEDEPKRNSAGKPARKQAAREIGPGILKIGQIFEKYPEIHNGYDQPYANRRVRSLRAVDEEVHNAPSKFRVICKHICLLLFQQLRCRKVDHEIFEKHERIFVLCDPSVVG